MNRVIKYVEFWSLLRTDNHVLWIYYLTIKLIRGIAYPAENRCTRIDGWENKLLLLILLLMGKFVNFYLISSKCTIVHQSSWAPLWQCNSINKELNQTLPVLFYIFLKLGTSGWTISVQRMKRVCSVIRFTLILLVLNCPKLGIIQVVVYIWVESTHRAQLYPSHAQPMILVLSVNQAHT